MPERFSQPRSTPEEYQRVRAAVLDPHNLPAEYAAFLQLAQKIEYSASFRGGANVSRPSADPDSLRAWCAEAGIPLAAEAAYAFSD